MFFMKCEKNVKYVAYSRTLVVHLSYSLSLSVDRIIDLFQTFVFSLRYQDSNE